jgi:hypothetical protein
LFLAFCLGTGFGVRSTNLGETGVAGGVFSILGGLMIALNVHITLGTVWGYVNGHRQADGDLTDPAFLAPFVFAAAVGLVVGAIVTAYPPMAAGRTELLVGQVAYIGLFAAFGAFYIAVGVASLVVNFRAGYEETRPDG